MKKEIIKSFDLEAYKNGAKIQTRNGNEVRIICTDTKRPSYPIIALVKVDDNRECIISYTTEGKEYYSSADSDPNDLVIVEEVEESEFWTDKEDNDEKIRKVLVDYFKIYKEQEECGIKTFYGIPADDILAWLEKQGTQPRYNIGDILCDKLCTTLNKDAQPNMEIVDIKNGMYICDKGSFPVSQQDEYVLVDKKIDSKLNDNSVSNELRAASFAHAEKELKNQTFPDNLEFELIYTFEEGAKWDAAQKSTWSEDDEYRTEKLLGWLNTLINYIQGDATVSLDLYRERKRQVEQLKTWFKSLKALNTWKPSDKQIIALKNFTRSVEERGYFSPYDDNIKLLYSLLSDLKKLRKE